MRGFCKSFRPPPGGQVNYDSSFAKWADWCQQRDRNPTAGPVKDINFLAELFKKGYHYQSPTQFLSLTAISSVHAQVDGYPVGQHSQVTRMFKRVFNKRPSLLRYPTF